MYAHRLVCIRIDLCVCASVTVCIRTALVCIRIDPMRMRIGFGVHAHRLVAYASVLVCIRIGLVCMRTAIRISLVRMPGVHTHGSGVYAHRLGVHTH